MSVGEGERCEAAAKRGHNVEQKNLGELHEQNHATLPFRLLLDYSIGPNANGCDLDSMCSCFPQPRPRNVW